MSLSIRSEEDLESEVFELPAGDLVGSSLNMNESGKMLDPDIELQTLEA